MNLNTKNIIGTMMNTMNYKLVQDAETFDALYAALDQVGTIPGSQKEYTASRMKEKIDYVRSMSTAENFGYIRWNLITRTYGLRGKVMELRWYEVHGVGQ